GRNGRIGRLRLQKRRGTARVPAAPRTGVRGAVRRPRRRHWRWQSAVEAEPVAGRRRDRRRSGRMRCGREGVPGEARPARPGRVRRRRVVVRGETRGEGRGTRRVRDGATPLASARPAQGVVEGRITIVQDDRIRLLDETGRGYLFVVKKRRASLAELERWRDA